MPLDVTGTASDRALLDDVLAAMPPAIATLLERDGIRFHFLQPQERFRNVDRKYMDHDRPDSQITKYGVYIPLDRRIILRSRLPEVISHEICHHSDAVLGRHDAGKQTFAGMRSERDPKIRAAYRKNRNDGLAISRYSLVSQAEWVAEATRAVLGFTKSGSRTSDRDRLARIDPALVDMLDGWTDELVAIAAAPAPEHRSPVSVSE
jgi:hypothetical protein